jgi:hypothetical protein
MNCQARAILLYLAFLGDLYGCSLSQDLAPATPRVESSKPPIAIAFSYVALIEPPRDVKVELPSELVLGNETHRYQNFSRLTSGFHKIHEAAPSLLASDAELVERCVNSKKANSKQCTVAGVALPTTLLLAYARGEPSRVVEETRTSLGEFNSSVRRNLQSHLACERLCLQQRRSRCMKC